MLATIPWEVTNDRRMIQVPPALQKPVPGLGTGRCRGAATVSCAMSPVWNIGATSPASIPPALPGSAQEAFSQLFQGKNQLTGHHWDAAMGKWRAASVIPEGQDRGSNMQRHCWV